MVLALDTGGWLIGAGALLVLWLVWTFNALVRRGNRVREAFSGVDVQLKRRHDLVPNLVRVVERYAKHEKDTLESVVEARDAARRAESLPDRSEREVSLSSSLSRLFALVEAYPVLKADENFRRLHKDLVEVEDALQYARRYYNGTVRDLNNLVQGIPSNLVALLAGRRAEPYFEIEREGERAVPAIDFDEAEA